MSPGPGNISFTHGKPGSSNGHWKISGIRTKISDEGVYFDEGDGSGEVPGYNIYDDDSRLEMAIYDDSVENTKNTPALGYISATYTGSGSTRTVTINDVSSSADCIVGLDKLKNRSHTLTFTDEHPTTYTIKK